MEGADRTGAGDPLPLPGWYPDEERPPGSRYWDGSRWTAQRAKQVQPRDLGTRAVWTYIGLGLAIAASLVYALVSLAYAGDVQTQIDGGGLALQDAIDSEDAFGGAGLFWILGHAAAAIAFLFWFHAGYSNLRGLTGRQLRYGSGWSVGAWFIPIFNLWRPKQIANDVWRGGDQASWGNADWASLPVSALVHWWWAAWILSGLIGGIGGGLINTEPILSDSAAGLAVSDSELEQERAAAVLTAISSFLEIPAGVLALLYVKRATDRQQARIANPSGT